MSPVSTLPSRHLSDYSFRLGPPDMDVHPASPISSQNGVWTLDDILGALTQGARVFESRTGLRLRHAHCRPGLAKALPFFSEEVRLWNKLELSDRLLEPVLKAWPPRIRLYMAWIDTILLQSNVDIEHRPGERVIDRHAFRASLQRRLWAGPSSSEAPRLLADLDSLYQSHAPLCVPEAPPARPVRLAA